MRRDGGRLLANRRLFAVADTGVPDGIRVDAEGNIWTGVGDGVACFSPGAAPLVDHAQGQAVSPCCGSEPLLWQ